MMEHEITAKQGRLLLKLARYEIGSRLGYDLPEPVLEASIPKEKKGAFVTLKLDGKLRGCIGTIEPISPLEECVRRNSVAAAFSDSRFEPLTAGEFDDLSLSVSVLSSPRPLDYDGPQELREALRPHIDGVILKLGSRSATFLPQVWEQLPSVEQFLSQLCLKAGLAGETWKRERVDISTYQVQHFSEEDK